MLSVSLVVTYDECVMWMAPKSMKTAINKNLSKNQNNGNMVHANITNKTINTVWHFPLHI